MKEETKAKIICTQLSIMICTAVGLLVLKEIKNPSNLGWLDLMVWGIVHFWIPVIGACIVVVGINLLLFKLNDYIQIRDKQ